ncbi:transmembrane amino acid transporter protein [Cryptosporidium andersoni]|uniref:Transmembrane amino acid transporter protein n=1 Tax=Cryptosporidium andersoni TaxID=117008 RepID=A0A1J4MP65_9CRYT|nr:transmembrane amino acid transporter protein [Cryptosporidium andersoni]
MFSKEQIGDIGDDEELAQFDVKSKEQDIESKVKVVPLKVSKLWIQMGIGFVTIVKATIGTGILFAPHVIVKSGYGISLWLLVFYWLLNVICTYLLFMCADIVNDTYPIIASSAFGILGRIVADVSMIMTEMSFCAVTVTFVTKTIQDVIAGIHNCLPEYINYGTELITFLQLIIYIPLVCFGRLQSLGPATFVANIALLIGFVIVFVYAVISLVNHIQSGLLYYIPAYTNPESIANFTGIAAFLWVSGPVALSYYVSLIDIHAKKIFVWIYLGSISFSFLCTSLFVFVMAYAYGENSLSTIILNLPVTPVAIAGQLLYVISVILSFPLMLFPVKEIVTEYINLIVRRIYISEIIEFTFPKEQVSANPSLFNVNSIVSTSIPVSLASINREMFKPKSEVMLRWPSGSLCISIKQNKWLNILIRISPSLVMILISILCCVLGYVLIDSLGNFVNLVGGIFCVPISIILPAIFHLALYRRITNILIIFMDIIIIIIGLLTSAVVIWYSITNWSTYSENLCDIKKYS